MIGICIKYYHENYGGMLQALATTKMLDKLGIRYELIRYKKKYTVVSIMKSLPRLLNRVLLNDKYEGLIKKAGKIKHPVYKQNDAVRMKAFHDFRDMHFTNLSAEFEGYEALCQSSKLYSAVITGSDQLWSPAGLPTNFYNLMFVSDDVLKVSLASSFGVKEIPWYQKKRTAQYLNRIDFISMRENRGSELVLELTGRNVPTILDPVFLLSKEEWENVIPNVREFQEPYIFAYFLGANQDHRAAVKAFAKEKNMKIVVLRHLDQYVEEDETFGDIAPYDVDPGRFLNYLRNAEYVFTDSFHGSAFSIINEKQFVLFNRYQENAAVSKNSRIDTLCKAFHLEERRYNSGMPLSALTEKRIAYDEVKSDLTHQMQITNEYIDLVMQEIKKRENPLAAGEEKT